MAQNIFKKWQNCEGPLIKCLFFILLCVHALVNKATEKRERGNMPALVSYAIKTRYK